MIVDGKRWVTIEDVARVARRGEKIDLRFNELFDESRRTLLERIKKGEVIYGVNTGVGAAASTRISRDELHEHQERLLTEHCAGTGQPSPEDVVRATIFIRINSLMKGYSAVRRDVVEALAKLLNEDVVPVVPEAGSVGASGDLIPLAHIGAVLTGRGEATYRGERVVAEEALRRAGLKPIRLSYKEGVALINGTSYSAAVISLALIDSAEMCKVADIALSMSSEALLAKSESFCGSLMRLRHHKGPRETSENVRKLTEGSRLIDSKSKVQDPYSIRCAPVVHGAVRDVLSSARRFVEDEINSVSDNPLVLENGRISTGCHFHGQYLAFSADMLAIALTTLGGISERRIFRLLDPNLNEGLPAFLSDDNSGTGLMLLQYTAASLMADNFVLSSPASVHSLPTSANQEDYVSMSATSGLKLRAVLRNLIKILAIELIVASKALELRGAERAGAGTRAAYEAIAGRISGEDQLSDRISSVEELIRDGDLLKRVEETVGKLR